MLKLFDFLNASIVTVVICKYPAIIKKYYEIL